MRSLVAWAIVTMLLGLGPARAAEGGAAPAAAAVRLASPSSASYVTGPTALVARIESTETPTRVDFFADGREVCTLTHPPFECSWDAGAGVVAHEIRLVVDFPNGRRIVRTVRTRGLKYAQHVDVNIVQVAVAVTKHGHFVKGLPESDFRLFDNGQQQKLTDFASGNSPLDLVVAIDISASMKPFMPELKSAVKTFLMTVPPMDRVTLLAFNENIFPVMQEATNPKDLVSSVDKLTAWGSTALYDVIIRGIDLLGRRAGRKALIVFTDGEDEGSHAPIGEAESRLQESDVALYMIGEGRGAMIKPLERIMRRLADPTGGRALFTKKISELHGAFADLLKELASQYLLSFKPSEAQEDGTLHTLKVKVKGHYHVRARRSYRAKRPS